MVQLPTAPLGPPRSGEENAGAAAVPEGTGLSRPPLEEGAKTRTFPGGDVSPPLLLGCTEVIVVVVPACFQPNSL